MSTMDTTGMPGDQTPAIRHGMDRWGNTIWFFFDKPIRVDDSGPEPMFCLKDCLEANGLTWKSKGKNRNRAEADRGIRTFNTPGGVQSFVTTTEEGFYILTMRGHKPCSDTFRGWLADVAKSLRKTGHYSAAAPPQPEVIAAPSGGQPGTTLEILLQQAQMMTAGLARQVVQEQQIAAVVAMQDADRQRTDSIDARLEKFELRRDIALEKTKSLPAPTVPAPEKTAADTTEQLLKFYATANGLDRNGRQALWIRLYEEVRRRLGVDVVRRFNNNPEKYGAKLDVVREEGAEFMAKVYAIACEMFPLTPTLHEEESA